MRARGGRELVSAQNPFVLGRYPDRPAPAHVFNGMVVAGLGGSARGAEVRQFLGSGEPLQDGLAFLDSGEWTKDGRRIAAFRTDLSLVLNPDRRMWESVGSLVPGHSLLANRDPSDDGFGATMWHLFRLHAPDGAVERFRELLEPEQASDPVTACALILTRGAEASEPPSIPGRDDAWFSLKGPRSGRLLSRNLASFLANLLEPDDGPRTAHLQHFGRGVYLCLVLAILLGPIAGEYEDTDVSIEGLAPLVVWGGIPPGSRGDPMVEACAQSFRRVVERGRSAIATTLTSALQSQELPSGLPAGQATRSRLIGQLIDGGVAETRAAVVLDRLLLESKVTLPNRVATDWCRELLDAVYPPEHVVSGVRAMGRKIGLIGPDRGSGAPRFLIETPLLGTLVAGLCPPGAGTSFRDFVDLARNKLGLVLGPGTSKDLVGRLSLWEGSGVGQRLLKRNEEMLRQRLLRAGLAAEYSDGHTEMITDAG